MLEFSPTNIKCYIFVNIIKHEKSRIVGNLPEGAVAIKIFRVADLKVTPRSNMTYLDQLNRVGAPVSKYTFFPLYKHIVIG